LSGNSTILAGQARMTEPDSEDSAAVDAWEALCRKEVAQVSILFSDMQFLTSAHKHILSRIF
jgi:hypothetical protein